MTNTASNWKGLITQTAGTSPYSYRRMLGSTPNDNTFLLDGFDATNWLDRDTNPAAENVPFDAVQEVALHTAGFEAEYGQATGGVVNVVTKSGGNVFAGTLDLRYTDSGLEESGEHYDPDEQVSELSRVSATLGGPIIRDRLWFFTTYGVTNEKTTPTGAPTTKDDTQELYMGKLSWQPGEAWSLVGKYSYAPLLFENDHSSQFRAPDATSKWTNDTAMASVELVGVLSDATLWALRLGHKRWDSTGLPQDGDLITIGHDNYYTGESYGNYGSQYYSWHDQNEIATDASWFLGGPAGSHELKAGLDYGEPRTSDDWCRNGGGRCRPGVEGFFFNDFVDEDGADHPSWMQAYMAEEPWDYGGWYGAAYLQDAWRLRPDLTLKLGLRWDRVRYENNVGKQIADISKLQPRVGVAWDVTGRGRSVLRASWGRFMHPGTLIMAIVTSEQSQPTEWWGSCSAFISADPAECASLSADRGLGYRTDQEGWDPAGWWLDPAEVLWEEAGQTADDLRAGYADQWVVAYEQEIFRRTSLELSYVNKVGRDMFDDTCNGNVPEPTPDVPCDFLVISNLPQIRFDYEGWMLRFESSGLDWLHLLASWVVSDSKGSMDLNHSGTGNFDFYPHHFVNRYGYLSDHSRHRVKINGYVLLPYEFTIAVGGFWDSDWRWTPIDPTTSPEMRWGSVFLEPRGNREEGPYHQLDLQFGKGFHIGPVHLELLARLINALDSEHTWWVCNKINGCGDFEMGDAIEWQQPRRYEVGFRVEF
jgi:hypothetical protein